MPLPRPKPDVPGGLAALLGPAKAITVVDCETTGPRIESTPMEIQADDLPSIRNHAELEFPTGFEPDGQYFPMVASALSDAAAILLAAKGLPIPSVRLVFAEDVWAAPVAEQARLGLPPDRRGGPERLGGFVVAGKTIESLDGSHFSIILPAWAAAASSDDGVSVLYAASIVGHELGHVLLDVRRRAALGSAPENVGLPWEIAPTIALLASAEYRADRFGLMLCASAVKPSASDQSPMDIALLHAPQFVDQLEAALDEVLPGLNKVVWRYRTHQVALGDMWSHVAKTSEEIAIVLAHVEAHTVGTGGTMRSIDHPAARLLEPLWRPLFDYLGSVGLPLGDDDGDWYADREEIQRIGLEGLTEVWRRLGLTSRPDGDSFVLSVDGPQRY